MLLPNGTVAARLVINIWLSAAPMTGLAVVRLKIQPPELVPLSSAASSCTNNCQAPLGLPPLRTDRVEP